MTEIDNGSNRAGFGQVVRVIIQLGDIADQDSGQIFLGNVARHDLISHMDVVVVIGQLDQ
jgi:hypothetical protein